MNAGGSARSPARWLRWVARGVGSLVAAFWLVVAIGSATTESGPFTWESAAMAALIITAVLGVLITWWREGIGGTIVLIAAVAYCVFAYATAGFNKGMAMLLAGGPWLLVAVLFLLTWWIARRWKS